MTIDLHRFCSKDVIRVNLHNPISQDGFTWASDGRIAIRVPHVMDYPESKTPSVSAVFNQFFIEDEKGELKVELPEITETEEDCRDCSGTGKAHKCPSCDCDCDVCDGDGKQSRKVSATILIGDVIFDAFYIKLISSLPGLKFSAKPTKDKAASFMFDGGEGILMPMRYDTPGATTIKATVILK